jgi:glycosyltransferase involved in cell wall biosynthesis
MFSVIIPLKDKEKTILLSLKSIQAQSYKDFEIIVVDDAGTDGGLALVNDWRKVTTNVPVQVVRSSGQGVSAARNTGANIARGEYLCFCDADDVWSALHLKTLAQHIAKFKRPGFLVARHVKAHVASDADVYEVQKKLEGKKFSSQHRAKTVGLRDYAINHRLIHTSATCVRIDVFNEVGGFVDGARKSQDISLWLKLLSTTNFCVTDKITSIKNTAFDGFAIRRSAVPYFFQEYLPGSSCNKPLLPTPFWLGMFLKRMAVINVLNHDKESEFEVSNSIMTMFRDATLFFYFLVILRKAAGIKKYITLRS